MKLLAQKDPFAVTTQEGLMPFVEFGAPAEAPASPVVLSLPHSGRCYPASFISSSQLSLQALRLGEDAYVDLLLKDLEHAGFSLLVATHGRSYLDLNRKANELDPDMFSPRLQEGGLALTHRVRAGLGCIPKISGRGQQIYKAPLPDSAHEERINALYAPYHTRLEQHIAARVTRFGHAVVLDCHSMPAPPHKRTDHKPWPAIVLGDCWGSSCAPSLTAKAEEIFQASDFSVRRNIPYAGGFVCQHYGQPSGGVQVLQLEINRSLYMNETTLAPLSHFNEVGLMLQHCLTQIADFAATLPVTAAAAE